MPPSSRDANLLEAARVAHLAAMLASAPAPPRTVIPVVPRPVVRPRRQPSGRSLNNMLWAMHASIHAQKRQRAKENQERAAQIQALRTRRK